MQKYMLLLATQKGLAVLLSIVNTNKVDIVGCVLTFKETISIDYEGDIKQICINNRIPHYHYTKAFGVKQLTNLVERHKVTTIVAIGWRYILPLSLNEILENPIIVFHDSLLPKYRGFAPTPTAIICGEKNIGVSILFAADGVDNGELIWQSKINIASDDYIQHVIDMQARRYVEGFEFIYRTNRKRGIKRLFRKMKAKQHIVFGVLRKIVGLIGKRMLRRFII